MIESTTITVPLEIIAEANNSLPQIDFKLSLNQPTGDFFYDPWEIKQEFKNTVWGKLLNTLQGSIGEARIIQLQHGTCYMSHCDIDNRYHLNIEGQYSFLIDVDSHVMFPTVADGRWYTINTGIRHVAANFGSFTRTQLVVRQLLNRAKLKNPVDITILPICVNPRFEFDDIVSPWLHKMNAQSNMTDFKVLDGGVSFQLEQHCLTDLRQFSADKFKITER